MMMSGQLDISNPLRNKMPEAKLPSFTSSRDGNDPEEKYGTYSEYTWFGSSDSERKLKSIVVWNDFRPDYKLVYNASGKTIQTLGNAAPLDLHLHLANEIVRLVSQYPR
jgi:hypothetical protein